MTIGEIQQVMRAAGWPESLIVKGAAIAYYESAHGNPRAGKVDSLESSYGLFQINLGRPGTALQRERAHLGPPERLYDPVYNARVAYDIYRQQGWNAWRTTAILYPQRYQQYMPASQAAYNAGGNAPAQTVEVSQVEDAADSAPVYYAGDVPLPEAPSFGLALAVGAALLALYVLSR